MIDPTGLLLVDQPSPRGAAPHERDGSHGESASGKSS